VAQGPLVCSEWFRSGRFGLALEALAQMSPWARTALGEVESARGWKDELLCLLFACCHPSPEVGESAASALIVESTIMNGRCLRVGKEFLALVDYKGSGLVVKLP